jgi:hypothetical protein
VKFSVEEVNRQLAKPYRCRVSSTAERTNNLRNSSPAIEKREIPMTLSVGGLIVAAGLIFWPFWLREQGSSPMRAAEFATDDNSYPGLEGKLRPLAVRLPAPRPGDWLAEHSEPGQTFAE